MIHAPVKKITIVMPVFNEKDTVVQAVGNIQAGPLPAGIEKEIIIIDDGSSDGTRELLKRFEGEKNIRIFYQPQNRGKTSALAFGFPYAKGDVIVVQDADLEYSPQDYPRLLDPIIKEEADVVYGSRFLGRISDMTVINRVANGLSNWTLNRLLGTTLTDFLTCLKVFRREVLRDVTIVSRHFSFEAEFTVKLIKKGFKIKEVPITYRARSCGKKMTWLTALELYGVLWKECFSGGRKKGA